MNTFRIPKGLWDDLEDTVIQQDRQFLTEVARSLGLPVKDVLQACLGPKATPIPVIWNPYGPIETCPYWNQHQSLWKPCMNPRMSPTMPCCVHEDGGGRLQSELGELVRRIPVKRGGILYWVDPLDPESPPLHENGELELGGVFRILPSGLAIWISKSLVVG